MNRVFFAACAALLLSACVTEQPANPQQSAQLGQTCQATYGFQAGTDAYLQCVFQLDQQRINRNRERRMAIAQAFSDAGAQMQANARQQQAIAAATRPVNCTSRQSYYGGPVYTNCY